MKKEPTNKNKLSGTNPDTENVFRKVLQHIEKPNGKDILNGHNYKKIKDVICFSHLRWNFVFQRPQHLLSRWAAETRVFYIEEPIRGKYDSNFLKTVYDQSGKSLTVITPYINESLSESAVNRFLENSLDDIIRWYNVENYLLWYLTPMAVEFAFHLSPEIIVYDSMDELSCFKGAHPNMIRNENILLEMADVVFTGGFSLYEYKKHRHHNIHPFPSSIDQSHFESGIGGKDPADQANIPHPRVGFFGVIDERFDTLLLDSLAMLMPQLHFIMIGPVLKIDPGSLPQHGNIHYLGQKNYFELPDYLAHWDVAILPFAKNESTRFISPTKTPEYLCAGKPVVSTSIRDVVLPYGELGLVEIADTPADFSTAILKLLNRGRDKEWEEKVKELLKSNSWDLTWLRMKEVIYKTLAEKENVLKEMSIADAHE
ncbi:MAG TPA: glycosyltransferase family 1 protein [Bacteroidales bacterium]|nr:glycosyltransferase family 1 protein [Bacteroidales bacterium]